MVAADTPTKDSTGRRERLKIFRSRIDAGSKHSCRPTLHAECDEYAKPIAVSAPHGRAFTLVWRCWSAQTVASTRNKAVIHKSRRAGPLPKLEANYSARNCTASNRASSPGCASNQIQSSPSKSDHTISNQTKPNQTKSNQIKPNQTKLCQPKSNMIKPNRKRSPDMLQ